jgi:predicted phosphoribosyltransferase
VATVLDAARVSEHAFDDVLGKELLELRRREAAYRDGRPALAVTGRTVVLVDDGLATGATMRAAVAAVRRQEPERVVVAVPIASPTALATLAREADETVCLSAPRGFRAVGQGYQDFGETVDDEVRRALARGPAVP